MHDHEGSVVRDRDVAGLERVEVDVERVAGDGAGDGQWVEQPDVGARVALGLLAGAGDAQRLVVVAECEQERDSERRARREPGADRERAGDPDRPAGRRRAQAKDALRQERLRRHRDGRLAERDLERLVRELVGVHADEKAARPGREGDLGLQLNGHRQRQPAVVVGVVADDGDSSGRTGRGHAPSLTQGGRPGPALRGIGCRRRTGLTSWAARVSILRWPTECEVDP